MKSHQLINQTSGAVEYYTPHAIIDAARFAMGGVISLDPASSALANQRVGALRWFGVECDGLSRTWEASTLWMNHPFSREGNAKWISKLIAEYECGNVKQACCITFAATSEKWFQPLLAFPQCFLSPRTNYHLPDGSLLRGVSKGSVVTYLGDDVRRFAMAFRNLGACKGPLLA